MNKFGPGWCSMSALKSSLQPGLQSPTEAEVRLAKESIRRLNSMLVDLNVPEEEGGESPTARTMIHVPGQSDSITLELSISTLRRLAEILAETAQGNAVSLTAIHEELTSTEAADLLNVSRPYLCKLLDNKEIPHHKVGRNRRVRLDDLMEYKRRIDEARHAVLDELAALGQELNLEY